jgi:hypothetical protein
VDGADVLLEDTANLGGIGLRGRRESLATTGPNTGGVAADATEERDDGQQAKDEGERRAS